MSRVPRTWKTKLLLHSRELIGKLVSYDERILDLLQKHNKPLLFSSEVIRGVWKNPVIVRKYLKIVMDEADHFLPYLKEKVIPKLQDGYPIALLAEYVSPQEMLEFLLHRDEDDKTPLHYIKSNREFLASTLRKMVYALANQMPEKDRRTLSYVVGFMAEDHRFFVNTELLVLTLEEMDWEAENWKDALFFPLLGEELARVFAHKEVLGKRGKWNRGKLMMLARAALWEPEEELLEALEELSPKQGFEVVKAYYLHQDEGWQELVIKHTKSENLLEKVALDYLPHKVGISKKDTSRFLATIEKNYPQLMEDILAWTSVFAHKENFSYFPLFHRIFLLSPEEYRKERYKDLKVPKELREAWIQNYQQLISLQDEKGRELVKAIQNINQELEKEGWKGPWLELGWIKEKGFEALREWEWQLLHNTSAEVYISLKPQLREVHSLIREKSPSSLTFLITDSRELLFRMGKGPKIYSCQAPDYWGEQKIGLLGAITHGSTKMAALLNEKGELIGRAKLHLLRKEGKYYVAVDHYYGEMKEVLVELLKPILENWKKRGLIADYRMFSDVEGEFASPLYAPLYLDIKLNGIKGLHFPKSRGDFS
ncbi:MAG: hypothetical protein GXN92_00650 [Candidatus Micrarchaeota archaeon]|nr:hypothetical protein [Candidatus Micrarchaeota archaeon]